MRLAQAPLQFVRPIWQVTEHIPLEQTLPGEQTTPHPPQLFTSLWRLTQVEPPPAPPSGPLPPSGTALTEGHTLSPCAQTSAHLPALHTLALPQTFPQAPQFFTSLVTSTQLPAQGVSVPVHWPRSGIIADPDVQPVTHSSPRSAID